MKKKINIAALALIMVASASAQTIYDGAKFTQKDLNGTARFVGMGGAMGATRRRYFYYGDKSGWYWYIS